MARRVAATAALAIALTVAAGICTWLVRVRAVADAVVQQGQLARVLIDAMQKLRITRLVCITGIGAGDSHGHGGFLYDHIAQPLLLNSTYHDKNRQEDEIRKSGLDWTIVRPTILTDGPATGAIRALTDLTGFHGGSIARADVARFLIKELEERRWAGQSPVITSAGAA